MPPTSADVPSLHVCIMYLFIYRYKVSTQNEMPKIFGILKIISFFIFSFLQRPEIFRTIIYEYNYLIVSICILHSCRPLQNVLSLWIYYSIENITFLIDFIKSLLLFLLLTIRTYITYYAIAYYIL